MVKPLNPLFRPAQQEAMQYKKGTMAISAVPGSGKTFTLAHLAADLIGRLNKTDLNRNREVLIVTFTNSAVNSLRHKIAQILQQDRGLLPYVGYRVRTLHGLAHDIVRERPALLGLTEDFRILDDQTSQHVLRNVTEANFNAYGGLLNAYIDAEYLDEGLPIRRLRTRDLPELMFQISSRFIKYCKDHRIAPGDFYASDQFDKLPLAQFGIRVYEDYQRSLMYQGAVDFDDLVRFALDAVTNEPTFLKRLQRRWRFILEDEAQDSTALQEQMLHMLTDKGNWIRVGDTNQAINTTFTTADPRFLENFTKIADNNIELKQSGRSGRPIIDLANALMAWTVKTHPIEDLRDSFSFRLMEPTLAGDPQPNPAISDTRVHIHYDPNIAVTADQEIELVMRSLQGWLPENPDKTVAVLVPENSRGFHMIEQLEANGIVSEELLRSTSHTREVVGAMHHILTYLSAPLETRFLAEVYKQVWFTWRMGNPEIWEAIGDEEQQAEALNKVVQAIRKCKAVERLLYPNDNPEIPLSSPVFAEYPDLLDDVVHFCDYVSYWLNAAILPVDQLVIIIAQDVFRDPVNIALCHKLAVLLRSTQQINPDWRLPELRLELKSISENERRFLGMDELVTSYEPRPGVVTVSTIHSAKGLEWDRVYLLSVNNYSFPSNLPEDRFISEKWFIRDELNLEAEALGQAQAVKDDTPYIEGLASKKARTDYAAERLRLLYVGITRARQELIMLWNTGRFGHNENLKTSPALPLQILSEYVNGTRIIDKE
jgi:DNA helicase-2/ATP-dependent DNA helicase PcrA